ncbi:hypothetical protein JG687_00004110 [Phytophthora cactorum]|uniref:Uncharacterized protein n=2 Tax=Phytophthora cactorum TaxID=29920 RepID=A0A8T1UUA0_9STRA|nr:hypothetical protein JG687_00004110 [Phytophthora cactorum]
MRTIKDRGDQALLANRTKEHPSRAGRFLRSTTGRLDYDNWRRCNSKRFNELAAEEIDKLENKEEYVAEANEIMRKLSAEYAKPTLRDYSADKLIIGPENPLASFLIMECALRGPTPIKKNGKHQVGVHQLDESSKKRSIEEIEYFHHFPFKLQYGIAIEINGTEEDLSRVREAAENPEVFSSWDELPGKELTISPATKWTSWGKLKRVNISARTSR